MNNYDVTTCTTAEQDCLGISQVPMDGYRLPTRKNGPSLGCLSVHGGTSETVLRCP